MCKGQLDCMLIFFPASLSFASSRVAGNQVQITLDTQPFLLSAQIFFPKNMLYWLIISLYLLLLLLNYYCEEQSCASVLIAQWIERLPGVREVMSCLGLIFFLCPTHMTCWTIHLPHFITELKIHHLYSLIITTIIIILSYAGQETCSYDIDIIYRGQIVVV